jgi:hypothetical protein
VKKVRHLRLVPSMQKMETAKPSEAIEAEVTVNNNSWAHLEKVPALEGDLGQLESARPELLCFLYLEFIRDTLRDLIAELNFNELSEEVLDVEEALWGIDDSLREIYLTHLQVLKVVETRLKNIEVLMIERNLQGPRDLQDVKEELTTIFEHLFKIFPAQQ